jgi:hypothetical protein
MVIFGRLHLVTKYVKMVEYLKMPDAIVQMDGTDHVVILVINVYCNIMFPLVVAVTFACVLSDVRMYIPYQKYC